MEQPASACRNRLDGLEIDERAVVGNDGVQLRALLNGQVALRLNGTERIGQPDRDALLFGFELPLGELAGLLCRFDPLEARLDLARGFANLGGDGKPAGAVKDAIAASFGGFPRFEELFRATALALAGGSGWTLLDLDFSTGDLRVFASRDHTQSLAFGAPLLVLDMFEHAYQMDYGAAAAKYIDAFFNNIQWEAVASRLESAQRACAMGG